MKSPKAVSLFFPVAVIGACALTCSSAWAGQTGFMFHGSVVNAGCNPQVVSAALPAIHSITLKASEQVSVRLIRADDACGQFTVPLQASYASLPAVEENPAAGIVTLTYQ